jgi:hypothetical protein
MKHIGLSHVALLLAALLSLSFGDAFAQTTEPSTAPVRVNSSAIVIALQTNHAHYVAGEPILLRASMTNVTSAAYAVFRDVVWNMVPITVRDPAGHLITPTRKPDFHSYHHMPIAVDLPAGQTDDLLGPDHGIWADLTHWGYDPLKPGTYTITGSLRAGVMQADAPKGAVSDTFVTSGDQGNARTSSVTITVESP